MKNTETMMTKQWRPFIHFTPEKNWLNDPNGMVYFNDMYHLFFQYNPTGDKHGNMHWGHAQSTDLVNWQEKDIAIYADPDGLGYVFSGGAVVDVNNTSGLGDGTVPPLVATFTHHSKDEVQVQSLAYSQDGGDTWVEYANNPVIANPGLKDFRDPKVIWDEENSQWVMALAVEHFIYFYVSSNLIDWTFASKFGEGHGTHGRVWECPDLFPLTTPCGITKWVLIVSLDPAGPNGGTGTQYFIGEFDGKQFISDHTETRWLDYGPDNYAGVTWDGLQPTSNKRIFIAWMSNWVYANDLPTNPWRGGMTLPRELTLVNSSKGIMLANLPSDDITSLKAAFSLTDANTLPESCAYEVVWKFDKSLGDNSITFFNSEDEKLVISYVAENNEIQLDRTQSGWNEKDFGRVATAPLKMTDENTIECSIIIDQSSVEVFTEKGLTTLTSNIFPKVPYSEFTTTRTSQLECFTLINKATS
ncbi:glycoside hydrolase family 32 protein [Pseudocolwellia agarivorans]|uniref:glycoside hydrolase family 32 protein n=1 Tax=Pseudocolwellia agarivorans TaxID=1911682 RepID=UPI0009869B7B|nr:glycoside hydrolase family 32 protein [Pseudocolwellia agarivorans]